MTTLTNKKASVLSRHAGHLQFDYITTDSTAVAGNRYIGGPSANQTNNGVFYPTVQSAIDDIAFRAELPVGSIITRHENTAPGFISQSDKIKFTGSISGETLGATVLIKVFGFPVEVIVGDSSVLVASKVNDVLLTAISQGLILAETSIDALDQSILNITYNDYQNHIFAPTTQYGCVMEQTIVQQPRAGYGQWEYLGAQDVTLQGGSVNGSTTLYHYKRVY